MTSEVFTLYEWLGYNSIPILPKRGGGGGGGALFSTVGHVSIAEIEARGFFGSQL